MGHSFASVLLYSTLPNLASIFLKYKMYAVISRHPVQA